MLYETVQWMAIAGGVVSSVWLKLRCNTLEDKLDFLYSAYKTMAADVATAEEKCEAMENQYKGVVREYQRMQESNEVVYNEHQRMAASLALLWKEFLDEQDWSMVDSEGGE